MQLWEQMVIFWGGVASGAVVGFLWGSHRMRRLILRYRWLER